MFPRLREYLDSDVVRYEPFLYEEAQEIEFRLGSGWKADFDLFEAHVEKKPVHIEFLADRHGVDQGLVPIPEIDAAPEGRGVDNTRGPPTVGKSDVLVRLVLVNRHSLHINPPR